ncbi:MAG: hypothetical protein ACOX52_11190 [Verrucomicrobiota bacterium]
MSESKSGSIPFLYGTLPSQHRSNWIARPGLSCPYPSPRPFDTDTDSDPDPDLSLPLTLKTWIKAMTLLTP